MKSLGFVTYVRIPDPSGTSHLPGIYLNARQLFEDLDFKGFHEAADVVAQWEALAFTTVDQVPYQRVVPYEGTQSPS